MTCDFGDLFMDVELSCTVDEAADMLFSYSPMFKELYQTRNTTNVSTTIEMRVCVCVCVRACVRA